MIKLLAVVGSLVLSCGAAVGAPTPTYRDPVAYCRAVGTIALPGKSYVGPEQPDWIRRAMSAEGDYQSVVWRCSKGRVLACLEGGSHPNCGQKDRSGRPTKPMRDYCRQNPGAAFIPGAVDGGYTIYSWKCRGARPAIDRVIFHVDAQGFPTNPDLWRKVSP